MEISELVYRSYKNAVDKGFHQEDEYGHKEVIRELMLVICEVAECVEELRIGNNLSACKEIADIYIRLSSLIGKLGVNIEKMIEEKLDENLTRRYKHGKLF